MDNINITTTQNVSLKYDAAGLGARLLAVLIDDVFKYTYLFIVYYIYDYFRRQSYNEYAYDQVEAAQERQVAIAIVCLLPFFLYHLLCETFLNGQSFGKKIMKIKVVKLDGTRASFGAYVLRSIFRFIDDGIIGVIAISVSQHSQRLGDMVAGTTVIRVNREVSLEDTILSTLETSYQETYPQVAVMNDKDVNIIKEVLDFSKKQGQTEHLNVLAAKIREKYGIADQSTEPELFLETILKDYSHHHSAS